MIANIFVSNIHVGYFSNYGGRVPVARVYLRLESKASFCMFCHVLLNYQNIGV